MPRPPLFQARCDWIGFEPATAASMRTPSRPLLKVRLVSVDVSAPCPPMKFPVPSTMWMPSPELPKFAVPSVLVPMLLARTYEFCDPASNRIPSRLPPMTLL